MPFQSAEDYLKERGGRIVASITGPDKYGKSFFQWTCPGPWWCMDVDLGSDESLKTAVAAGKDFADLGLHEQVTLDRVHVAPHLIDEKVGTIPKNFLVTNEGESDREASARFLKEAEDHYRYLKDLLVPINEDYFEALHDANEVGGTVCVDPASKWWTLVSAVKQFEAEVLKARKWHRDRKELADDRRDYGLANAAMDGLMLRALHLPRVNVIFTQKAVPDWGKDEEKKEQIGGALETVYRSNGYRGTGAIVQTSLMLKHNDDGDIVARVDSSRFKRELVGAEIAAPSYTTVRRFLWGEEDE